MGGSVSKCQWRARDARASMGTQFALDDWCFYEQPLDVAVAQAGMAFNAGAYMRSAGAEALPYVGQA